MASKEQLRRQARRIAIRKGLDPDIFVRQIQQESGFNVNARSPAGAQGIAQFIPSTAKAYGVNVRDPRSSLEGAAEYMRDNLKKYGSYRRALSAYNSGRPDGYKNIAETRNYVKVILGGKNPSGPSRTRTRTRTIPGVDRSADRQALLRQYLATQHDPDALLNLSAGLKSAQDTPSRTVREPTGKRLSSGGDESKRVIQLSRLAHSLGLKTTSGKRDRMSTASGGVSDHFKGNTDADARDLSGSPEAMRRAAKEIAKRLGVKYKPGVTNVVKGGYRYQLIHETNVGGDHYDHVHIGVKKV